MRTADKFIEFKNRVNKSVHTRSDASRIAKKEQGDYLIPTVTLNGCQGVRRLVSKDQCNIPAFFLCLIQRRGPEHTKRQEKR